jgi:hypothetical protein
VDTGAMAVTRLISMMDPPVRFDTKASFRCLYNSSGVFMLASPEVERPDVRKVLVGSPTSNMTTD